MKLTWLGHSCFSLESNGYTIVLDPFEHVRGLKDTHTQAQAVYCSHDHFDHAFLPGVKILPDSPCPFRIREVSSFHDQQRGALRGTNTIRCFEAEGLTVVHLGDLGHLLSKSQIDAIGHCDALLLPIGGTFTLDPVEAKQTADSLNPRVIIPMHYRSEEKGFEELCTLDAFTQLYPPAFVHPHKGRTFELTADTPPQLAALQY